MKYKYTFFEKSTENYWENHYSLISLQLNRNSLQLYHLYLYLYLYLYPNPNLNPKLYKKQNSLLVS